MNRPLFLLTDFGTDGHYHGVMKGVVEARAPGTRCFDLGHGIRPGAVREAAYVLEASLAYLPADGVVVAVVDPGVGSERAILLLEVEERILIAPDNGLLTPWLGGSAVPRGLSVEALHVDPAAISRTFHGRDLFAPAAAEIASGAAIASLGDLHPEPELLARFHPELAGDRLLGEVVHIDRFGNLISNIKAESMARVAAPIVHVGGEDLTISQTFSDVARGELLAYIGSSGHIEVAVRDESAASRLGVGLGTRFSLFGV